MNKVSFLLSLFITVVFVGSTVYGIWRTFKKKR